MNEINISKVDLNLLRSLDVLLDELHVGRAAKRMNVTQSAMSHTLSRLRTTFDDPLFIRTAKGLEPTSRALELSEKLRFILGEIDTLLSPKKLDITQVKARFCIQTHDFVVTSYLSSILRKMKKEAPNIIFDLQLLNAEAYEKLDAGKLDMIIGAGLSANPRLIQKRLLDEPLVCLLDDQHPALNDWCIETIFLYPHVKSSLIEDKDDPVALFCKDNGISERKVGLYTESLNSQISLISGTDLIAFLPASIAALGAKVYGLASQPSTFPLPDVSIRALWHERHQNDPVHQWVRNRISEEFEAFR
ncbi:LysR family transcriptional regulator [Vibrio sp. HN007]|uniref:LysR family transcriptional regulator n=1 Tax=Vibrio iocasae TaxID=3098914 RepID=UPI0035D4F37F